MDKFQNIKTENKKKRKTGNGRNMSAVCFGFTQGEEAQVRKLVFSSFFEIHETIVLLLKLIQYILQNIMQQTMDP